MKINKIDQFFNHPVTGSDDCSCAVGCDLAVGGELWVDGGDAGPSAFSRAARALVDRQRVVENMEQG